MRGKLLFVWTFCAVMSAATTAQARFLQTDPVGYQDDLDLYTYVQDDPANKTDPAGEVAWTCNVEVANGSLKGATCNASDDGQPNSTITFVIHEVNTDATGSYDSYWSFTNVYVRHPWSFSEALFAPSDEDLIASQLKMFSGGRDVRESGSFPSEIAAAAIGLAPSMARKLGGLAPRAGETVRDVARSRGASAANLREAGPWADKTLEETAEAAVQGDQSAEKAIKITKEAARLGKKF